MEEDQIETLSFEYLYDMEMDALMQIAMEKGVPDLDQMEREELISAIELSVLSGLEEAEASVEMEETGESEEYEEDEESEEPDESEEPEESVEE